MQFSGRKNTFFNKSLNLYDTLDRDFLDMIPKTQVTKEKIDQWYFIQIKNFCASNDTTTKVKR